MPNINVTIGDKITNQTKNAISGRAELNKAFAGIAGNADSKLSTHPGDSIQFIGISEKGLEVFCTALDKYISKIQDILKRFNSSASLDMAFAGAHKDAAQNFVKATEELLSRYVSTLGVFRSEAARALENYKSASQQIANKVNADADTLRKSASHINLDSTTK